MMVGQSYLPVIGFFQKLKINKLEYGHYSINNFGQITQE